MHAIIRRYRFNSCDSDRLRDAGERFGAALSRVGGFIAAVTLDERGGTPFTLALFEDQAGLTAAENIALQWSATEPETFRLEPVSLSTAEVVAQKGL